MKKLDSCYEDELEALIYRKIKDRYNKLMDSLEDLARFYRYKTPLDLSGFFNYMLFGNYLFAKDDKYMPAYVTLLEQADISGANVVAGYGVCRHRSMMLYDLLRRFRILCMMIVGLLKLSVKIDDPGSATPKEIEELKAKISDNIEIGNTLKTIVEKGIQYEPVPLGDDYYFHTAGCHNNHGILLAGKKKKIFVDPTLNCYYKEASGQGITMRADNGIHFFASYPGLGTTCEEMLKFLLPENRGKTFVKIMNKPSYEEQEIIERCKEINAHLEDTKKYLEEFKRANQEIMDEIRDLNVGYRLSLMKANK